MLPVVEGGEAGLGANAQIIVGDCVEEMAKMPADSVDAIVTDPPYGLEFMGKEWDRLWTNHPDGQQGRINGQGGMDTWNRTPQYKGGLAAQAWHEVWAREAFRVLKPGGFAVVAGGTRTYHRLVCALEDAGFEIRDTIAHIYGSGFPKSKSMKDIGRPELGTALKPAFEPWTLARKPLSEKNVAQNVLKHGTGAINVDATRVEGTPHCGGAGMASSGKTLNQYSDYEPGPNKPGNTAGRWPPNLLLSHVGGPNGCKPTGEVRRVKAAWGQPNRGNFDGAMFNPGDKEHRKPVGYTDPDGTEPQEVWICHESCPIRLLDEMSGQTPSGGDVKPYKRASHENYSGSFPDNTSEFKRDKGGASRFFPRFEAPFRYQAKASRRERNAGLEGMPEKRKNGDSNEWGKYGISSPEQRGKRGRSPVHVVHQNNHPTVKPVALMRWLVRLVTPSGGTVLDPFMGSGSTGCAAVQEGVNFIGIEQDPEYAEIARRRIAHRAGESSERLEKPNGHAPKRNTYGFASTDVVRRCPEHGEPIPSGSTTYKCGCAKVWTKREDVIPETSPPLETLF